MTTIKYEVPSIHCHHCVHTIKSELSEMKGITSVEGDPMNKEIVVQFETPATSEAIESLMAEINYPVKK